MKVPYIASPCSESELASLAPEEQDTFVVVKNHRQACLRRYLRKIRKAKLLQKKREQSCWFHEAEKKRNSMLNYSMLREQSLWEVLMDDQKGDLNSETQQSSGEKISRIQRAVEFVQQLPVWSKQTLYSQQFQPFAFAM